MYITHGSSFRSKEAEHKSRKFFFVYYQVYIAQMFFSYFIYYTRARMASRIKNNFIFDPLLTEKKNSIKNSRKGIYM